MPISTPASSRKRKRAIAARASRRKPTSTARWTARASSCAATPWRACSSPASISSAAFTSAWLQMGLSADESVQQFSLLSVGDGLVSQIPALLISTAAGILVTRSGSEAGLGEDFMRQMLSNRRVVPTTGVMLWCMMLVPGFPKFVLLVMGGIFVGLSRILPHGETAAAGAGAG